MLCFCFSDCRDIGVPSFVALFFAGFPGWGIAGFEFLSCEASVHLSQLAEFWGPPSFRIGRGAEFGNMLSDGKLNGIGEQFDIVIEG